MLPKLLEQIPAEEPIGTVTADGAYDTRACHAAIAARQATAVIPTRRNGCPWRETTPGAHARNDILRASRRFGRAIWRTWSGYHRRSRIEIVLTLECAPDTGRYQAALLTGVRALRFSNWTGLR